jgi:hypothetical protein
VPGNTISRKRLGFDASWFGGPVDLMAEMSFGTDADDTIVNSLIEMNWRPPAGDVLVYLQVRQDSRQFDAAAAGWSTRVQTRLGFQWAPDNHWVLSGEWVQNLANFEERPSDTTYRLQARYRF